MNDREDSKVYKELADKIQSVIKLDNVVAKWNSDDFIKCDTFRCFDEYIIKNLSDILQSGASEFDNYLSTIYKRKS
ncbi:hypothetical protein Q5M85_03525 [Paraclostridium bifermentans]|nr:hypothetical protein [Paraclostridium bifermentans]